MPRRWRSTRNNWRRCKSRKPGRTTFEKQLTDEQKAFEHQQSSHYAKVYFNGLIDTLQVDVLDFSKATLTRKDLDLPVLRFDKNSLQKTVQALPMAVTVYDDSTASWLKTATMTEDQLKNSVTISQSVEDASAAHIVFDHPYTFNDELAGTERNSDEAPVTFSQPMKSEARRAHRVAERSLRAEPCTRHAHLDLNLFPENPAFVVGSIPLFLASIDQATIDVAKLPKGLSLKTRADRRPGAVPVRQLALLCQGRQRQLPQGNPRGQPPRRGIRHGVV